MARLIYPENYTPPDPPAPHELTTAQRAFVKTFMQEKINQFGPLPLAELVRKGVLWARNQHSKNVLPSVFREIALEIQDEWYPSGYPWQGQDE